MSYEENDINWAIGSIVIHAGDSKDHKMLMVVTGGKSIDGEILLETEYLNPMEIVPNCLKRVRGDKILKRIKSHYTQTWTNAIKYLHDPAKFGIEITESDNEKVNAMFSAFLKGE
jgi:hypothetical protein